VVIPEPLVSYRFHGQSISAKRFFDQRMLHSYVVARNKAAKEGKTLKMEDYIADYKQKPLMQRFFRDMNNRGRFHYRNTGVYLAQKQYPQAMMSLALSVVYSPKFSTGRILNRVFPKRFI